MNEEPVAAPGEVDYVRTLIGKVRSADTLFQRFDGLTQAQQNVAVREIMDRVGTMEWDSTGILLIETALQDVLRRSSNSGHGQ